MNRSTLPDLFKSDILTIKLNNQNKPQKIGGSFALNLTPENPTNNNTKNVYANTPSNLSLNNFSDFNNRKSAFSSMKNRSSTTNVTLMKDLKQNEGNLMKNRSHSQAIKISDKFNVYSNQQRTDLQYQSSNMLTQTSSQFETTAYKPNNQHLFHNGKPSSKLTINRLKPSCSINFKQSSYPLNHIPINQQTQQIHSLADLHNKNLILIKKAQIQNFKHIKIKFPTDQMSRTYNNYGICLEEADSLKNRVEIIEDQGIEMQAVMKECKNVSKVLKQGLNKFKQTFINNLDQMVMDFSQKLSNLHQSLSFYRRQTSQQSKINKRQTQKIIIQIQQFANVFIILQNRSTKLRNECIQDQRRQLTDSKTYISWQKQNQYQQNQNEYNHSSMNDNLHNKNKNMISVSIGRNNKRSQTSQTKRNSISRMKVHERALSTSHGKRGMTSLADLYNKNLNLQFNQNNNNKDDDQEQLIINYYQQFQNGANDYEQIQNIDQNIIQCDASIKYVQNNDKYNQQNLSQMKKNTPNTKKLNNQIDKPVSSKKKTVNWSQKIIEFNDF